MPTRTVVHYVRRKAAGLCCRCPQPAMPGFVHCEDHHARALAAARRNEARRKAQGRCSKCAADAVPGKSMCPIHREAARVSAERQRTKRALRIPLTPPAPVAVDWGALGGAETSGTSSPSRRCGRCGSRAIAAVSHETARCLACGWSSAAVSESVPSPVMVEPVSLSAAAACFGVSACTLRRWIDRGDVLGSEAAGRGSRRVVDAASVRLFLAAHRRAAA